MTANKPVANRGEKRKRVSPHNRICRPLRWQE
jgi:hypothetical protein